MAKRLQAYGVRIVFVIVIFATLVKKTYAQSSSGTVEPGPGVADVFSAVISARAELKSWVLRAKCSDEDNRYSESANTLFYGVCDGDSQQFRFETKGWVRIGLQSAGAPQSDTKEERRKEAESLQRLYKTVSLIVKNRDYLLEWQGLGESTEPGGHGTCHKELRDCDTMPILLGSSAFNPQAAGLIDIYSPNRLESVKAILERLLLKATSVTLVDSTSPELQLVFAYSTRGRRILYIDRDKGFTISRSTTVGMDANGKEMAAPRTESNAKWEMKNGTWVPVRFSWTRVDKDGSVRRTQYDVDWESVNPEKIDDSKFDYRTYKGFWPGLSLIDRRGGKVLVLEAP